MHESVSPLRPRMPQGGRLDAKDRGFETRRLRISRSNFRWPESRWDAPSHGTTPAAAWTIATMPARTASAPLVEARLTQGCVPPALQAAALGPVRFPRPNGRLLKKSLALT